MLKTFLRIYRSPLAAAVMLVVAVAAWGWYALTSLERDSLAGLQQRTGSVFDSLAGVVDSLNRHAPYNLNHLAIILNGVVRTTGLRFAVIVQDGQQVVAVGAVPDRLPALSGRGETMAGGCFLAWRTISLKRMLEYYDGSENGEQRLVLGLDLAAYAAGHTRAVRGLAVRFAAAIIGVIAITVIWGLTIHARGLSAELNLTRLQKEHFEELGLAAAGLAHEARNPLGIIRGIAQQLGRADGGPEAVADAAGQIIDAVDRTSSRLGAFMAYARSTEPVLQPVNLAMMFAKVTRVLQSDFDTAGVQLTVGHPGVTVMCDEDMLMQLLVNLLTNSLHASPAGTTVTLTAAMRGGMAEIAVADQGSGIPDALRPDIFKPYVSGRPDGHGLGLAVVKRIVERHGWRIDVDSRPGAGTTMRVSSLTVKELKGDRGAYLE